MKAVVWNIISNIKNGQLAKKLSIKQFNHKYCISILDVLWDEGFILGYKVSTINSKYILVYLKYINSIPCIQSVKIVSKPSFKFCYSLKQIWKLKLNRSLLIITTNKGIFSYEECKKYNLGGEPIILLK